MGNSFGPFMQSWIRALIVIAILLPIALYTRVWQSIRWRRDKWLLSGFVLVNSFIGPSQYYATTRIGIGLTLLTLYSGYLLAMFVLGWRFNGERYSADKRAATVLAGVGLVLTFGSSLGHAAPFPFFAALIAGIFIGAQMLTVQKLRYNAAQTNILAWATGMVGTVPLAFLLHEHAPSLQARAQWGYLLAFVAVCIASSWLCMHGVKLVEAGAAGILGLLEIVWGMLFGILFFHERPAGLVYLGAACIIAAAAIPYLKGFKKPKQYEVIEEVPV